MTDRHLVRQYSADRDVPLLYHRLREIAAGYLKREPHDHTLQPTALVNEVYIKLRKSRTLQFKSDEHFVNSIASVMRRLLVDHARVRATQKRAGDRDRVTLSGLTDDKDFASEIIALNDALNSLRKKHTQMAQLVELRYFAGLTLEEAAVQLGVSRTTAALIWRRAKVWLHRDMSD
ncbi:MAG: ECF-type sigma factor [Myxococcota bacterium]